MTNDEESTEKARRCEREFSKASLSAPQDAGRRAREATRTRLDEQKREKERFVGRWCSGVAGRLIERGFPWARVDIRANEAFPRKPVGGHPRGEGLRHQWGCQGKAPAPSVAILSSVAIKDFLTRHGGPVAEYFLEG